MHRPLGCAVIQQPGLRQQTISAEQEPLASSVGDSAALVRALPKRALQRLRFYYSTRAHPGHQDGLDLDLFAHQLISCDRFQRISVTQRGHGVLAQYREQTRARQRSHDSLASRLADWLRKGGRLAWENIRLDSPLGSVRPDVYSIVKTTIAERQAPLIHECKVSRADFLADVRKQEKRDSYRSLAVGVIYACPAGLIEPKEIPAGCGLWVEEEDGTWRIVKRGRRHPITLSPNTWMRLLLNSESGTD